MDPDDDLRAELRSTFDEVLTPPGGRTSNPCLHLQGASCPAVQREWTSLRRKALAVFPPGYREWCPYCLRDYTDGEVEAGSETIPEPERNGKPEIER